MARSRALSVDEDAEGVAEWSAAYRERLTRPALVERFEWEPTRIGPTWQRDGDRWRLPEHTLGWQMLGWCTYWLQASRGEPWKFTDEQSRFLLWWYATDDAGRFLYRDCVLQRLKGWGKDPLGACIGLFELVGPCTVVDVVDSEPVAAPHPDPWVQIAAVSLDQTKNTMRFLQRLPTRHCVESFDLSVAKESAYAGARFLQAVTSSPSTLQGARSSFVLLNETHEWTTNDGHEMANVLADNSAKSAGGAARTLRITNAYEPGEGSVAEIDRDAWEDVQEGKMLDSGLLYDSLEAAPDAPLTPDAAPEVVRSVRGDSTWLDLESVRKRITDGRTPPPRARRYWYNQIVAAEDAWADPNTVKAAQVDDHLDPDDEVVMFGDGSKSDDATGLVACRISDGLCQTLHVEHPRPGETVSREALDRAVHEAVGLYRVRAFWFDPSHAKDENAVGDDRWWWPLCDSWSREFGRSLKLHPVKSGPRAHAVAFDMSSHANQAVFVPAVEQALADLESGELRFVRSASLVSHLCNARRNPNTRWGVTIRKDHRESRHKIDLAVCLVGARMLRRMYLLGSNSPGRTPGRGRVIGMT